MEVHYFAGNVATEVHLGNLPGIGEIRILTDSTIEIAFWNAALGDYGVGEAINAPGDEVSCASSRAKITGTNAKVVVKP